VAALLHDVGRSPVVVSDLGSQAGGDHGDLAARWLAPRVGERIAWLARQHVAAKRYLRAVDPDYPLTPASLRSLQAQGGPLDDDELAAFRAHPWWREAVALRRWDDAGKRAGLSVPGLDSYRPQLREVTEWYQR
jgi:gamma-butyrobetaine dioxygenase